VRTLSLLFVLSIVVAGCGGKTLRPIAEPRPGPVVDKEGQIPITAIESLIDPSDEKSQLTVRSFVLDSQQVTRVSDGIKLADPAQVFPSSFWTPTELSFCSATLVGPNAVLMAAHCVSEGEKVKLTFGGVTTKATCHPHPEFHPQTLQRDVAVCKLTADVTHEQLKYENADVSTIPQKDSVLMIAGFGCDHTDINRTFRVGFVTIETAPTENDDRFTAIGHGALVNSAAQLLKKPTGSPASLCGGDSGGATFRYDTAGTGSLSGVKRFVVGVNSSVHKDGKSSIASLGTDGIKAFLLKHAENGAKICGITPGVSNCR
jgi:hypothetical protein